MHLPVTALPGAPSLFADPATQAIAAQVFGARSNWFSLGYGNSPAFSALTLTNGQLTFPATQVPSSNANTLDDYEEGTFTPVFTFTTPGDLNIVYSEQTGFYTKIGRQVTMMIKITTSTFTFTTSSGNVQITGIPFTSQSTASSRTIGVLRWQGITKAGYTQISSLLPNGSSTISLTANGSGLAASNVSAADMPSGGAVVLDINHTYFTA